jgi:hypothetical protein
VASANPSQGTFDTATGVWNIGTIGAFNGPLVFLSATVNQAPGPLTISATITASSQPDPNPANNTATPPPANRPPIADAGADQAVATGSPLTLDGRASSDPDGDAITLHWAFVLRPGSTAATLAGAGTSSPSFTPDQPGTYRIEVRATDSQGAVSAPDTVTITAAGLSRPPEILSAPVTAGSVGQPYSYEVLGFDPDLGDTLVFSLPVAPAGMTIAAATGAIQWTPGASQAGPQPVTVRLQDQRGLFAEQAFAVQVSSAANRAPVAADDTYSVRVSEGQRYRP